MPGARVPHPSPLLGRVGTTYATQFVRSTNPPSANDVSPGSPAAALRLSSAAETIVPAGPAAAENHA